MSIIAGIPLIGDIIKTVFGSRQERDKYQADARSAVYQQFAGEFGHGKTWWDSLIDGLNRFPRPAMTFGTIYLFWLCWTDPEKFIHGAIALQAMPKEGWYVLGAIVTFWFAAKLPKDFGKYKIKTRHAEISKTLSAAQDSQRAAHLNEDPDPQEGLEWEERVEKRYAYENLNE